jgi:hypothetical protein
VSTYWPTNHLPQSARPLIKPSPNAPQEHSLFLATTGFHRAHNRLPSGIALDLPGGERGQGPRAASEASAWVRLSQVIALRESQDVALGLAKPWIVGAWLALVSRPPY